MSILIEESDKGYIIAVREWAELQLGRPIKHLYNTKSNAVRAVRDRSRNTVTLLCQLAWENARRAAQLELIMFKITKAISHYTPEDDAGTGVTDAGETGSDC